MYTLMFISNGDECYWYESFVTLMEAVRAAHSYGSKEDLYQVFDSEHKIIFTGRV